MTAAAFFDLDRTLMAGSSGLHWARAARSNGLVSRRKMAAYAWRNVKFRLRGSTDEETDAVRAEVAGMLEGVRVRDLQRLAPKVLAGVLPRLYPQMLAVAYEHQDAGRPVYIVTAASQDLASVIAQIVGLRRRHRGAVRGRRRSLHRQGRGHLHLSRRQAAGHARARRGGGHLA